MESDRACAKHLDPSCLEHRAALGHGWGSGRGSKLEGKLDEVPALVEGVTGKMPQQREDKAQLWQEEWGLTVGLLWGVVARRWLYDGHEVGGGRGFFHCHSRPSVTLDREGPRLIDWLWWWIAGGGVVRRFP
ncbi:hypothetical protein NL676_039172 [Syzygium grande]|nr:hypothetical protein NL676_039172 [Syzygium grande]